MLGVDFGEPTTFINPCCPSYVFWSTPARGEGGKGSSAEVWVPTALFNPLGHG